MVIIIVITITVYILRMGPGAVPWFVGSGFAGLLPLLPSAVHLYCPINFPYVRFYSIAILLLLLFATSVNAIFCE